MRPGERFGPYDVLEVLGAGGMGVVYRARDPRLGREVAIKTLAGAGAFDPSRLQRFSHEVRAASALNHPNVIAVYDVGEERGVPYLVTELLAGQSLRERLKQGRLTPRKAIEIGLQIARGLSAVHACGIVHRDLKPENVFITGDGRAKILDFGIARSDGATPPGTLPLTQAGAVVGTAGYMAPEQVRGLPADARSDVFALGAILFEMVTGSVAFGGDTPVERGYAVLNADPPDPDALGVSVPPALARVIRRCLEKEPEERFQHARDLAFALEAVTDASGTGAALEGGRRPPRPWGWAVLALAIVAAAVISIVAVTQATASARRGAPAAAPAVTRLTFRAGAISSARFTSDHRTIVYSGQFEGEPAQVFAGTIGAPHSRALTPAATRLLDVTDRDELIYAGIAGKMGEEPVLSRMSLSGGAPRQLMEGVLYADQAADGTLMVVRRAGNRTTLEAPPGKVIVESLDLLFKPRFSPAGDRIAYQRHPVLVQDSGYIEVVDREGKPIARSADAWTLNGIAWNPKTKEVWFTASSQGPERGLRALSMKGQERDVLRVPGNMTLHDIDAEGRLLMGVGNTRARMYGQLFGADRERNLSWFDGSIPMDVSDDGDALLFHEGFGAGTNEVQTFLRTAREPVPVLVAQGMGHALSPDKRWAVVAPVAPFNTLTLVPTGPGEPRALPPMPGVTAVLLVRFFPDGQRLVVSTLRDDGKPRLFLQDLPRDAPLPPPRLVADADLKLYAAPPSKDGRTLVAFEGAEHRPSLVDVESGASTPLREIGPNTFPFQWTADGKGLFLFRMEPPPDHLTMDILEYDIATATTRRIKTIGPTDPVGVDRLTELMITPDGRHHVYRARQRLETLYLMEGVR